MFNIIKPKLISISLSVLLGCSDEVEKNHINFSNKSDHQQMVAALRQLPAETGTEKYRHFHIIGDTQSERRMIQNLHDTLMKPDIKVVSIGCEELSSCSAIVTASLLMILEKEMRRTDLTIILPDDIPTPPAMDTIRATVIRYEVPSFKRDTGY